MLYHQKNHNYMYISLNLHIGFAMILIQQYTCFKTNFSLLVLGYTLTFDNVNQQQTARHQHRGDPGNARLNMVQGYAAKDRIPSPSKNTAPDPNGIREIPISCMLPSDEELNSIRHEMTIIVMRILSSRMEGFRSVEDEIPKHIKHEFSKESSKKSEIVSTGDQTVYAYV